METAILKLAEIKAAAYNPRKALKPGDEDYERLKNSITEFGFVEPIIVNRRNMVIVGGHQRFTILKELGIEQTQAVMVDLDEDKEKALNIALNKIEGEWDMDKLQDVLAGLPEADIIRTSFSDLEIKDILKDIEANEGKEADQEQETTSDSQGTTENEGEPEQPEENPAKGFEIYLSFTTQEAGEEWLASHGVEQKFSDSRSVVLNMEEANTNAVD